MTDITHLVEQHILKHESRRQHVDELLERVGKEAGGAAVGQEISVELEGLTQERDRLVGRLDELKQKSAEEWEKEELEKAGPMGIWDAVAQQLEKLVERIER